MNESKLNALKNFTLLLVDDEKELLDKLDTILSIFFKKVITAKDGSQALEIYENRKIDMIITDYTMPNLSGYELCKAIRVKNKNIPLVIMSNYSDKEKLLNSIPLSLARYLIKPIDYTTLISTLLSMLEQINIYGLNIINITEVLTYEMHTKILTDNKKKIELSSSEIELIELFVLNKNKIITMQEINLCLDPIEEKSKPAIKSLIYRLRKKIGKEVIINIPGYGYMLRTEGSFID
ncbi:response regulator transcription factor [Poseidonibacter antarcticus]|uniref:response regulator transcription factor n=1 Tax=Poseidonibacter antarcticus TaxID=2478538 RepID=UPI000EF4C733|nr:response regulator transcription factor [Poseidonibacter antarcticus]